MKVVYFFILFFLFNLKTFSADVPFLSPNFEQNPPEIFWKVIETENFQIIFPQEISLQAQKVANLLEQSYPYVTRSLEVKPPKISLILQNQSTISNAMVTLAPRRSEWFMTPSINPELTNTEWFKTLAIHEFRHVVQFQKTRRGFNDLYETLFGEVGQALGLGLTLPPWFLEGDAVGIETALTRGGRGRLPIFERDLRTILLNGKKWNYDKSHLGSFKDYVPNHYIYGYFFTSWFRNNYGDLFLSRLTNSAAESSWNPLTFYNAVGFMTGEKFEDLYEKMISDLTVEWKSRASKLSPTEYSVESPRKKNDWTNYLYPQVAEDGKILALKNGLSFINQFVLLGGDQEEILFYPGPLQNDYPFKLRRGKFAFFELEIDPRWGVRDYARLKVFDLNSKKFVLDKKKLKGRLATIDHEGKKILYVDWDEVKGQFLVVLDEHGSEVLRLPYPTEKIITGLDWLNSDEIILVIKDEEDYKSIVQFNLSTNTEKLLLEKRLTNIGFLTVEDGNILFEAPDTGVDNIWQLTDKGVIQLTSSLYGAYAPEISDNKLVFNNYTVDGMEIAKKNQNWDLEQSSENVFFPIYEKFAKDENFKDFDEILKTKKTYEVSDYSQLKNSINLHSWVILAPPLSSSLTLMGISRDVLNKFGLNAGGEYNLNERTAQGFVTATWSHYYPGLDLGASYGGRRQDLTFKGTRVEDEWEEGRFEAGLSVPWKYISGRFNHSFTLRAFSKVIRVINKLTEDMSEIRQGALHSPGLELSYYFLERMAKRDLNPRWGLSFNGRQERGRNISGPELEGNLISLDSRYYLPGLLKHHSFYHQVAYEKQKDDSYQYSSFVLYPRGTRSLFLSEFTKYSGNYLFPVFYPDTNLSRYLYLKRISLNLFYDELNGRVSSFDYRAASFGWETLFDLNLVRLFIPITLGVRGSYILEGAEKKNNYEFFFTTLLGTF